MYNLGFKTEQVILFPSFFIQIFIKKEIKTMAKKTIVEQIKETQMELEKARAEKKQMENQLAKIQKQGQLKERKERTRKLIEKGAILESIDPNLAKLEGEYLKEYLQILFAKPEVQIGLKNNLLLQERQI